MHSKVLYPCIVLSYLQGLYACSVFHFNDVMKRLEFVLRCYHSTFRIAVKAITGMLYRGSIAKARIEVDCNIEATR